jgi:hypothetical protein
LENKPRRRRGAAKKTVTLRLRNSSLPSSLGRLNTMILKTRRLKTSLPPARGAGDWLLWSSSYGAEHLHSAGFF